MLVENSYTAITAKIKAEIETARLKASISVNQHLLVLYWKIGNIILQQQNAEGWGTRVIERLSIDLRREFPDMKGTSSRNLKYMRAFAEAYPEFVQAPLAQLEDYAIVQQPVALLENDQIAQSPVTPIQNNPIVQQPVAQIPWGQNVVILDRVKNKKERIFYAQKTLENNWSRNVLVHQIESKLYHRQGKAISNFTQTLPALQSDLAREMMKAPYKI